MSISLEEPGVLPRSAQVYVGLVIVAGTVLLGVSFPHALPRFPLFTFLVLMSCVTSVWKINLPISLSSGSTLSVSYAANLMALLLLGVDAAVLVGAAGVWTQCTFNVKRRYPFYRTAFSIAAEIVTMVATGAVYRALGGTVTPSEFTPLFRPVVGAITAYFVVNTGLIATAIGLSTARNPLIVWREDFSWSAASFMVAGSAGALGAVIVARGEQWKAILLIAPIYLTYRTYLLFVGRLEEERRHNAEMEAASRLKDQFLATLSHELRTPLNAILGWSEMLRTGTINETRREHAVEAIFNNATRQARLIDDLLDMARIMAGKLRLEMEAVEPADLVAAVLEIVQPDADAKRLHIEVVVDPNVGAVLGDATRLQQVLWNLVANAIKFTPTAGRIRLRVIRAGSHARFVVMDSGAGIAPEFLPNVFEPFRQADATHTRLHGGLGLGLAIVKQLVEAHSGTITVDSEGEGRGAIFTVDLPAVPSARRAPVDAAAPGVASSLYGISVLVVDDDEESRVVVAAHLENHQATVLTAASARDALRVLQREHVDVLLADVAMPGEDGYTLLRKVRALDRFAARTIPAAALTAFARDEDRREALAAGFQMHLAKPIDAASLVAAVAALSRVVAMGRVGSPTLAQLHH